MKMKKKKKKGIKAATRIVISFAPLDTNKKRNSSTLINRLNTSLALYKRNTPPQFYKYNMRKEIRKVRNEKSQVRGS